MLTHYNSSLFHPFDCAPVLSIRARAVGQKLCAAFCSPIGSCAPQHQVSLLLVIMDTLFLETGTALEAKVHPVVLFSILDHFLRRQPGQTRVIGMLLALCFNVPLLWLTCHFAAGTLLGSTHGGVVQVRSCFPVTHVEKNGDVRARLDRCGGARLPSFVFTACCRQRLQYKAPRVAPHGQPQGDHCRLVRAALRGECRDAIVSAHGVVLVSVSGMQPPAMDRLFPSLRASSTTFTLLSALDQCCCQWIRP